METLDYEAKVLELGFSAEKKYWTERLRDHDQLTGLPPDKVGYEKQESCYALYRSELSNEVSQLLLKIGNRSEQGIFAIFLAASSYLLSRYNNIEDAMIMIPSEHGEAGLTALLPLSTVITGPEQTFRQYLYEVREQYQEAHKYSSYPFTGFQAMLNLQKQRPSMPFVITYNVWADTPLDELATVDLIFSFKLHEDQITIESRYDETLYTLEMIELWHERVKQVLPSLLLQPDKPLAEANIVTAREKQLLANMNKTDKIAIEQLTLVERFERQVAQDPDRIAILFEQSRVTFGELNAKANQMARKLRTKNIGRDTIIGLYMQRSMEMIVGMLAVMKAGAAYVPIDPSYPISRVSYMLQDSSCNIVLTQSAIRHDLEEQPVELILMDEEAGYTGDSDNLQIACCYGDLAYLIYTSGSTGTPKGVMIEHGSLANLFEGICDQIEYCENKSMISLTSYSFDIFILESLIPLGCGMRIVMANDRQSKNSKEIGALITTHNVEMLQLTPSLLTFLLSFEESPDYWSKLTSIMVGGEVFPAKLAAKLRSRTNASIYNMYGPTETSVWSLIHPITATDTVQLGRPIHNTKIYVLNRHYQLQPLGASGELYISGLGVARGYWRLPELTSSKFIPNPFDDGQLLYHTGDMVSLMPDGILRYIGRADDMVKIRGVRIELSEVEMSLRRHPNVENAAVTVNSDGNDQLSITAYILPSDSSEMESIIHDLVNEMPFAMVPRTWITVDHIPLTPNGKTDRKALQSLHACKKEEAAVPEQALTETEMFLIETWEEILQTNSVSVLDNFFELGGYSLHAVQLEIAVENKFTMPVDDMVSIKIKTLSTIRELAAWIDQVAEQ
ncbi:non-ribosomal peptide synthetase [Paenibacillus sp. P32E]|uniref:non-ribosomal peptide synthetase n=1 Tax=Paenibacillus sp. P32E TaxID=1349434 RepID=UPI00093ACDB7|nr:non-ribosomal peptide synthetase [Paenibacillus sp. P32E]OKP94754.1 hypothetical protein A3848_01915 [Paenibacillus sp. P32E]